PRSIRRASKSKGIAVWVLPPQRVKPCADLPFPSFAPGASSACRTERGDAYYWRALTGRAANHASQLPSCQRLECGESGETLSTSAEYKTENDCAEMAEMAHHVRCLIGTNLLR